MLGTVKGVGVRPRAGDDLLPEQERERPAEETGASAPGSVLMVPLVM